MINPAPRPPPVRLVQFALGGRVFPPEKFWIQITERFRGAVLRCLREILTGQRAATPKDLSLEQRAATRLMTGKEVDGTPVRDHQHISFFLVPDDTGQPTRLLAHRAKPFTAVEQSALLAASETPLHWESGNPNCLLRLVPLPAETPLPFGRDLFATATRWRSLTPYVPARHVLATNGKLKPGESVREQLARDLEQMGIIALLASLGEHGSSWVKAHHPGQKRSGQINRDKRGYNVTLVFSQPVTGPLALGHSNHFGLGLFVPVVYSGSQDG